MLRFKYIIIIDVLLLARCNSTNDL